MANVTTFDPQPQVAHKQYKRKTKGYVNNTRAPSSLHKRLTKQLAGIMAHLERNPNDALSRARVATIQQLLRQ